MISADHFPSLYLPIYQHHSVAHGITKAPLDLLVANFAQSFVLLETSSPINKSSKPELSKQYCKKRHQYIRRASQRIKYTQLSATFRLQTGLRLPCSFAIYHIPCFIRRSSPPRTLPVTHKSQNQYNTYCATRGIYRICPGGVEGGSKSDLSSPQIPGTRVGRAAAGSEEFELVIRMVHTSNGSAKPSFHSIQQQQRDVASAIRHCPVATSAGRTSRAHCSVGAATRR